MSGPKCGEWSVEANLERERRIAAELRAAIQRVRGDVEAIRKKWRTASEEYNHDFPCAPSVTTERCPESEDNDGLRAALQRLRTEFANLQVEFAEAESVHRIRGLLAAAANQRENQTRYKTNTSEVFKVNVSERKARLAKVLSTLDPTLPSTEKEKVECLGRDALAKIDDAKFDGVLLEMQFLIQKSNQRKRERALELEKVQMHLDSLTGLESPEVLRLSQELQQVRRGAARLRPETDSAIAAIATAAKAEDDRRYASKVLIEELEKLGYSTSSGMETVLVKGGELEVTKADLKEYAVRFAVDRETGQFDVHLTRDSDGNETASNERRLRDRNMEEQWCGDLATVLSTAADRGVVARITRREKPGVVPVSVRRGVDGRRRAGATKTRSMQLPRSG